MRILKILLTLLTSILLVGCSTQSSTTSVNDPAIIEVESITTSEPNINIDINGSCMLRYTIYPSNATDKSITVQTLGVKDIVTIVVDDYNSVFVFGKAEGTGSLCIYTSNNKSVEYSITVTDPDSGLEPEPELSAIDRIANYFNKAAAEAGYVIYYYNNLQYWWLQTSFGYCSDPTPVILGQVVQIFKPFFPDYMFRYDEKYNGIEYRLIMVNSNISAAAEVYSYVENETLFAEVVIFSVW